MIRASIDIGTNSALLLVADVKSGRLTVLHEEQRIPRLGQGVDESGMLSAAAQQRVLAVLKDYHAILKSRFNEVVSDTIVTATSAVRDAANRSEFLDHIKNTTGWNVTLLSGEEEAQVTYRGALSVLEKENQNGRVAVVDIGGGSTEIAFGREGVLREFISHNMGSVRFTERFLKDSPPSGPQVGEALAEARKLLYGWKERPAAGTELVGVAGTVTSLAGIDLGLKKYDPAKINGFKVQRSFVETMIDEFRSLTGDEIEKRYPVFLQGRGEVILGGVLILLESMKWAECDAITVSTGGIRHGILLENDH